MLCQTEEAVTAAEKELHILKNYKHPNLLHLIDSQVCPTRSGDKEYLFLLPLYNRGTLQAALDRGHPYTPAEILQIFSGLCAAVACFHQQQPSQAHNDIKVIYMGTTFTPIARKRAADRREGLASCAV